VERKRRLVLDEFLARNNGDGLGRLIAYIDEVHAVSTRAAGHFTPMSSMSRKWQPGGRLWGTPHSLPATAIGVFATQLVNGWKIVFVRHVAPDVVPYNVPPNAAREMNRCRVA